MNAVLPSPFFSSNEQGTLRERTLFIAIFLLTWTAVATKGQETLPIDPLWKSEEFVKAYTASYGVDSKIEPLLNEDEGFYLSEAAKLIAAGDRPGAIRKLLDSTLAEKSPAILFSLGNFHYEEGKPEEGIGYFRKAIALYPNFRDAHRNLAMLLVQKGDFDGAEKHLLRAIELGSQEGLTFGLLAYCHGSKGRHQAALAAYRMAQVTMPEERQWRLGEAASLQSLDKGVEAASIFRELLEKDPGNATLWLQLANARIQEGKIPEAIACLDVSRRIAPLDASNRIVLGQLYLDQELPAEALGQFKEALALRKIPLARANEALRNLVARQHWKEAAEFGKLCAAQFPPSPAPDPAEANEQARLTRNLALIDLETGKTAEGAKRVEALLAKDPVDGEALILLARFRESEGKVEEALLLLEQAAATPTRRTAALEARGKLLVSQYRYKEAVSVLEEVYKADPRPGLREYLQAVRELVSE